jgi:[CysO sulfur-carrier protein]-S-L-cysteine hydrolase
LLISRALLDELIAHAREEAPNECCGVVAVDGASGAPAGQARATMVHRAINIAASPLRFEVDGKELLAAMDEIEAGGGELGAIYHSHTRSAPYPSQTDINFAVNWPGVEWIIVGLASGERPEVRSYLIESGQVHEVGLHEAAPQQREDAR